MCSLFHFFQENQSQTTLHPTVTKRFIYVSCWTDWHPILSSESLLSSPSTAHHSLSTATVFSWLGSGTHTVCSPSSKILIPTFHITQVTHLLYRRIAQILMATWGFFSFSNTLFYLSPPLTIHPSSGLLLEKFLYMAFKKIMKGKKERKTPIPFSNNW